MPSRDTLHLGAGLDLPLKFATEGVIVTGIRGSGKTNTLVRWAELLYEAGIPFTAIDPKGDWDGIRSSADGKHPGLSVPIFGGLNGNFPLDEHMGIRIADVLVDTGLCAVLDVSRLTLGARARFLADFFDRIMDRHQRERHVRCVIFGEAHRYIPQQVPTALARLKEAAAAILLEGRSFGLGCWAETQRVARLNKDVSEEVDTAIVHRIGVAATNDLKTISGWVKHEELSPEIVPSLTKLRAGEAWVLAPSTLGIVQRVQIDRRTTFDSAATPLVGAGSRPTITMADIDVGAINEALADSIEKAKADDPKELRRRIVDLEAQLRKAATVVAEPEEVEVKVPVPIFPDGAIGDLAACIDHAEAVVQHMETFLSAAKLELQVGEARETSRAQREVSVPARHTRATTRPVQPAPPKAKVPTPAAGPGAGLPGPQRKLLTVLANHGPRTIRQLGMQAGYVTTGGAFRNPLGALRSAGYVSPVKGEPIAITEEGLAALGHYDPLPKGQELLDHWMSSLPGPCRKILAVVVDVWPKSISVTDLAAEAGYEPTGGAFRNPLGKLRTLELVTRGGDVRLTDDFGEAIS